MPLVRNVANSRQVRILIDKIEQMTGFERSILRKVAAVRLRLPCLHRIGSLERREVRRMTEVPQ